MSSLLGKLLEIIITNLITLISFIVLCQLIISIVPLGYYYKISFFIIIIFLTYQDIKILKN